MDQNKELLDLIKSTIIFKEYFPNIAGDSETLKFITSPTSRIPIPCHLIQHPGIPCWKYFITRFFRTWISALKVQLVFTLMPGIIQKRD